MKEEKKENERKKIAVIFPGIGYTCKRPLLYYTASEAEDLGYEVIRLDYGEDIHSVKSRDMNDVGDLTDKAVKRSLEQLKDIRFEKYKDTVMISKSVGTVIAVQTAEKLKINARHFMITPIPNTVPLLKKMHGIFLSGTGDPYITKAEVLEAAGKYPDKTGKIYKDCNHSLERKGHTEDNLDNLREVVKLLKKFLKKGKKAKQEKQKDEEQEKKKNKEQKSRKQKK